MLIGITKAGHHAGGFVSQMKSRLNLELHLILAKLSLVEGVEFRCSGEMRRDLEEYRWRRRPLDED